jgi:phosphoglucosamine mutase
MKKLFGTDGMRGEAGTFPLDAKTMRITGRSLARHLAAHGKRDGGGALRIIIGRDTRESGAWLEEMLIEGAREAGAECESAGVITTPGIAYLARTRPADAGVVISASHNPYQDNGVKIFAPTGRKLDDATERLIEADILAAQSEESESAVDKGQRLRREKISESKEAAALRARYLDYLAEEVAAGLSLSGLRAVIDCANGAASQLAPLLFERLGVHIIAINNEPDGRNINRDCGSLYLDGLRAQVRAEDAHLGIAFDGDADRALFVDRRGQIVDGDAVLWAMAQYFDERGALVNKRVVATVMSNIGLEIALRTRSLHLVRTDVGDKYVLEELLRSGAVVGGEQSGHIIFPQYSLAGDGMMTALFLLRAMRESKLELDELVAGFTRYPQVLVNVRVREKRPFMEVEPIARAASEIETRLGETGRLLLRYSGTEPLARIMIEGRDQETIEREAQALAKIIKKELGALLPAGE